MSTNEKKVSMNRAVPDWLSTHNRPFTRSAVLTLALVALIAASVLPGYSSSHATRLATRQAGTEPQGLTVTPAYDRSRSVTQIVLADGGTVTATGGDGTQFTLIVPVNSLLSAARITMTPVTAVGGLPLSGGLAAAVQLEPDGLRLFNMATLVIEPPQSVSPSLETSFAWDQTGDDFHLFPMLPPSSIQRENVKASGPQLSPRGLVFKLLHFSGYGVGSGTDADRAAQQQRQPSGSEARFEQRLEAIMGKERKRQLATAQTAAEIDSVRTTADDDDPDYLSELVQLHQDRYTNEVKPAMDAALISKDDRDLQCAVQKALGWERQTELLGLTGKFFTKTYKKLWKFIRQALDIVGENASQRCSKEHKPEEVATLLGVARMQELLGFDDSKTIENAKRCAHLELEFDSEIDLETGAGPLKMHVHAKVPLPVGLNATIDGPLGEAPLEYSSCQWILTDTDCSVTIVTQDATLLVASLNVDLNPRTIGDCNTSNSAGTLNIISVIIIPGIPREVITLICPDDPPLTVTLPGWSATFDKFHSDEAVSDPALGYSVSGWEAANGSLLGRRTYSRDGSLDGLPMTERTAINLWHRPE